MGSESQFHESLQVLVLCRFNNALVDHFLDEGLIPTAEKFGTVRMVTNASNDHNESDYWISIVHRLMFTSDVVFLITNNMGSNVRWVENNYIQKTSLSNKNHFDTFLEFCGLTSKEIETLSRPEVITLRLTRRLIRKGRFKVKSWSRFQSAEIEVTQSDTKIQAQVFNLIENARRHKKDKIAQLSGSQDALESYENIRRAVFSDPEIRASVEAFSEDSVIEPSVQAVSQYKELVSVIADSQMYATLGNMLPILRKMDEYRPCSIKDLRNLRNAMRMWPPIVSDDSAESKRMIHGIFVFTVMFLYLAWVYRLVVFPFRIFVYLARKL